MAQITTTEVKAILGITSSDNDTRITTLIPLVLDKIREHCQNPFITLNGRYTDSAISFINSDSSINGAAADIAKFGLVADDELYVEFTELNNGFFTVVSESSGKIVVSETIIDEAAGDTFRISKVYWPPATDLIVSDIIDFNLKSRTGLAAKKLGDGSETYTVSLPKSILRDLQAFQKVTFV